MPSLSTGLVIAGAYADKLRRTLFAQLSNQIKEGRIESSEVARAAAEINQLIYNILVDALKIDKGDVVRIRIDYEVSDGKISWKKDTLNLEIFKRVDEEKIKQTIQEIIKS